VAVEGAVAVLDVGDDRVFDYSRAAGARDAGFDRVINDDARKVDVALVTRRDADVAGVMDAYFCERRITRAVERDAASRARDRDAADGRGGADLDGRGRGDARDRDASEARAGERDRFVDDEVLSIETVGEPYMRRRDRDRRRSL
jgi:hypothetical protein